MDARDGITEESLFRLVTTFYERVRQDPEIGPIFNKAVHDWPSHLETLTSFWHAVMLTSGRYKGNPVAAHLRHGDIRAEHFDRWLALWRGTTNELMAPADAEALQNKAERIGESLKLALFYRADAVANAIRRKQAEGGRD